MKKLYCVGSLFQMNSGLSLEVVEYIGSNKIKVRFLESGYEVWVSGAQIRNKCVVDAPTRYAKVGDRFTMKEGNVLEIIAYRSSTDIDVRFLDTGYETTVEKVQINRGTIQDLMRPRAVGVGFLGVGRHSQYIGPKTPSWTYARWYNILTRSYSCAWKDKHPSYLNATVVDEWHNFQNFADWAESQVGFEQAGWGIDKDVLVKGNKIYSPNTCCFLPHELNTVILLRGLDRGEFPVGVTYDKNCGNYRAYCNKGGGSRLRSEPFNTAEEAFYCYKRDKEEHIKSLAEKWKTQIDPRAYEALCNFQIEVTD